MAHFPAVAIILNPRAQRGAALERADELVWRLRAAGMHPTLYQTGGVGDATRLARIHAHSGAYELVIAAGGDGTINEVVNGVLGSPVPLGFIPLGTGNDLVKMFDLPANQPAAAIERIVTAQDRLIDVGRVNGRAFVNGVGIGLDAQIALEAQRIKLGSGVGVYVLAMLRALQAYQTPALTITCDGTQFSGRYLLVTVGNGGCHGGGFWLAPTARIDDGQLDVCLAQAMPLHQIVRTLPAIFQRRPITTPGVSLATAQQVHVLAPSGVPVHVDGEVIGTLNEITIELHAAELRVRV